MPDHADAPVAGVAARPAARLVAAAGLGDAPRFRLQRRGAQGLADRRPHRVKLVVAGHLLDRRAAVVLEDDEVAQQRQEAALLEDALDRHLQLGVEDRRQVLTVDRAPRLEPLPAGGEGAEPRLHPVRREEHRVAGEQRGDLRHVGLQLVECRPHGGAGVGRVLQLDHRQRQAVDEQHEVGPAGVAVFDHGELVDRRPGVGAGIIEVDHLRLRAADGAAGGPVLDRHPVHQQAVEGAVARCQGGPRRPRQLAKGVVERLLRQAGVEAAQGAAHGALEHHLRMAGAHPVRSGRHLRPAGHVVAELPKPVERRILHHRLGQHRHRQSSPVTMTNLTVPARRRPPLPSRAGPASTPSASPAGDPGPGARTPTRHPAD